MVDPPGQPLREGSLNNEVETTRFVYVGGITRQPLSWLRSVLRTIGVDTKKIYNISFVGGQVRSLYQYRVRGHDREGVNRWEAL